MALELGTELHRRAFLRSVGAVGLTATVGRGFWHRALAAPAQSGSSPYGPLLPPDPNGLMLPAGFTSRVVATSLAPVEGTTHLWHIFPDGGGCFPTDDGGWIYVSNSENPPPANSPGTGALPAGQFDPLVPLPVSGGVSALRFAADGAIVDAYPVLEGSRSNCAGGITPWGTWLSCEEWEDPQGYAAGRVWECDPFGRQPAVVRPALGMFKHEMAACDPDRAQVYLTEDQPDGLIYRYSAPAGSWGSGAAFEGGALHAMRVAPDGSTVWISVNDVADPAAPAAPLRTLVVGATPFNGGEGAFFDDGLVYFTTKGDNRVWVHDVNAQTMSVLYDAADDPAPVLNGVDNLVVSVAHDLYVAEDGGNLEVCIITPELVTAPVVRMTGGQHGFESGTPIPFISEVTGLALSPDGNRLYFSSERALGLPGLPVGPGPGITYEVIGPFRGGTLAAPPAVTTVPSTAPTGAPTTGRRAIPATGRDMNLTGAGAAAVAGGVLWYLRGRAATPDPH